MSVTNKTKDNLATLSRLLHSDLDFHEQQSSYASHNFHSFPAKFPPQLPKKFILGLTNEGEVVLDPMNGSGTTILEAQLANRKGIGLDIDPLALKISQVKTTPLRSLPVHETGIQLLAAARCGLESYPERLEKFLASRWDEQSRKFIDYWFLKQAQLELAALLIEIEKIEDPKVRRFFQIVFSGIVITKSGGVSLALDLAHTRPHRAKRVIERNGKSVFSDIEESEPAKSHLVKKQRSPFEEFEKRLRSNIKGLQNSSANPTGLVSADAQIMPIASDSIDLIVTSPPYASNAIDYMRAHKFSLVWLGFPIQVLSEKRSEYIGNEARSDIQFETLPEFTQKIVEEIRALDSRKGYAIHRYYSEMLRALREMYRVLKPGRCAIVVVATSVMRGKDTQTKNCLADIGRQIGFIVPGIGVRNLDRDRRMMPVSNQQNHASQIQQRIHEEYVIGFFKP
ncbi:MAG: DNA methyltransferase [Chloroflexota bacterium]